MGEELDLALPMTLLGDIPTPGERLEPCADEFCTRGELKVGELERLSLFACAFACIDSIFLFQ